MWSTTSSNKVNETIEWFFDKIGYFCHYGFFTKKLWKKVDGFEHKDEGEVIAAFLSWWLWHKDGEKSGPRCIPCGMTWGTVLDWEDERMDEYFKEYMPVFRAYTDWCMSQR